MNTESTQSLVDQAELKLKSVFGFDSLHEKQKAILTAIFEGQDVLAMLPTGYGKSMTYILPAIVKNQTTLVISPLISLIHDQVAKLRKSNVEVLSFDSMQSFDERKQVWEDMRQSGSQIIYASPERMLMPKFRDLIKRYCNVGLIAVDEAHCVSTWGRQFRPSYHKLGDILCEFGDIPKVALTATATQNVQLEICEKLGLKNPKKFAMNPIRENLNIRIYQASRNDELIEEICSTVRYFKGSGIVYAPSRKRVEEVYYALKRQKESVGMYHAGLDSNTRASQQKRFINNETRVVVATTAFGMGIDKPDIRFVVHAGLPGSLEQYLQEIGRAGRDGKKAYAYLFYGGRDYHIQKFILEKSYPDEKILTKIQSEAKDHSETISTFEEESQFYKGLKKSLGIERQELLSVLKTLERNGIWKRNSSRAPDEEQSNPTNLLDVKHDLFKNYIHSIPHHIEKDLQKLGTMYEYAKSAKNDRTSIIENYFSIQNPGQT